MTGSGAVTDFLAEAIERSGKSQKEIAREVGYPHANIITMMKQGTTKVPVEKAPAIARALGVDPAQFVRLVMREYHPNAWKAIEASLGEVLTADERRLLDTYRDACSDDEIAVDDNVVRALRAGLRRG